MHQEKGFTWEPLHQLRWFPSPKGEAFYIQAPSFISGSLEKGAGKPQA